MDEGGRKQVKFILKEGLIHIVGNHGLPNNNIEGELEAPGFEGLPVEYSVNGSPYVKSNGTLKVSKEDLKKSSIQISARIFKDKKVLYFKSDTIPLTHAIIFGKSLEESYPEALKFLLREINEIREMMGLTKKQLHQNMVELVDTFEEDRKSVV